MFNSRFSQSRFSQSRFSQSRFAGNAFGEAQSNTLNAESASFSWTGTDAELIAPLALDAESASYAWTGTDVEITTTFTLSADSASYTWTGTDAELTPPLTATYDGTSTTFSTPVDEIDLDDDGTPDITVSSAELTAMEDGPIIDDAFPASLTGSGYTLTIEPGAWMYLDTPENFSISWEVRPSVGAAITQGSTTGIDDYAYTDDLIDGETLTLWMQATDSNGTQTYASADTYVVPDRAPDAIGFTNATDVALNTTVESEWIELTGTDADTEIRVEDTIGTANGEYRLADDGSGTNATAWTSEAGTFSPGQWAQVRGDSAGTVSTDTRPTLFVGREVVEQDGNFKITTIAAGASGGEVFDDSSGTEVLDDSTGTEIFDDAA